MMLKLNIPSTHLLLSDVLVNVCRRYLQSHYLCFLLSLVLLKVSSSWYLREFLATVTSGLPISVVILYPDFYKNCFVFLLLHYANIIELNRIELKTGPAIFSYLKGDKNYGFWENVSLCLQWNLLTISHLLIRRKKTVSLHPNLQSVAKQSKCCYCENVLRDITTNQRCMDM